MRRRSVFSLLIPILLVTMPPVGHGEGLPDYQVKAAFIYNFTKFIELPDTQFASSEAPLTICLLGKHRNQEALTSLSGKEAKGRKIKVHEVAEKDLEGCHLLFVAKSEESRVHDILAQVPEGVLTVGESSNFIANGGIINFILIDNRIRFDINNEQARKARISISSHLLRLANKVKD